MLKQAYLDELDKIVKCSHTIYFKNGSPVPPALYVKVAFGPLAEYGILDNDITSEDYDEIIAKSEEIIALLDPNNLTQNMQS